MTIETLPEGVPAGFVLRSTKEFATQAGPFYAPPDGDSLGCGFLASAKHGNKRGVVHGGMLATAFDVALGNASWSAAGQKPCATVQLNVHFIGAVKMGDFAFVRVEVMKATRTLVFLRGVMTVTASIGVDGAGIDGAGIDGAGVERLVATADGVWKILDWRGEPFKVS